MTKKLYIVWRSEDDWASRDNFKTAFVDKHKAWDQIRDVVLEDIGVESDGKTIDDMIDIVRLIWWVVYTNRVSFRITGRDYKYRIREATLDLSLLQE